MNKKIIVENVTKKFKLGKKDSSFLSRLLFQKNQKRDSIEALKGVSFQVEENEKIGIIGSNGSGKSTLLRILAEIYFPDFGEINLNGKVVYLNGFGHGLKQKLTMKENIFLMGSILGLSKRKIEKIFKEIIEFSELQEFTEVKVCKFSSGMVARLNFAIGIYCLKSQNPEILLLDEVFSSGGDENFKKKIKEKINEIMKKGSTILIASHDLSLIKEYCDRVIWMEKGKIQEIGSPEKIVQKYLEYSKNKTNNQTSKFL